MRDHSWPWYWDLSLSMGTAAALGANPADGQPVAWVVPCIVPPQAQDFLFPHAELLRSPALSDYNPGVMQRAAPSQNSAQEKEFDHHHSKASLGSTGW